ncbi:MAG: exodeoxyribonuclease VII small subunit [Erysipelotrichaceae bacterium]|nr:exodeoxyribonuclease VII small subunit [Erysipelotrichaceae bacterium]
MAKQSFESKIKKLEEIVSKLDDEDTDLDSSIALYEEGLKLSDELKKQLETYKERIANIEANNNE